MVDKYGKSLATTLLLILQVYDSYRKLRQIVDERPASDSDDDKKALALRKACAGASSTHPRPPNHNLHVLV